MAREWTSIVGAIIAIMSLATGCVSTTDHIVAEMGEQMFEQACIGKNGESSDCGVDELINRCIEASKDLGFWYDASKSTSGKFSFHAKWKGTTVYFTVQTVRLNDSTLYLDYVAGSRGDAYGDGADNKIWKVFLGSVSKVEERNNRLPEPTEDIVTDGSTQKRSKSTGGPGDNSLVGTTWYGKDSDGEFIELRFADHGVVYRRCPGVSWKKATWKRNANMVHIDVNKGYAQYEGVIHGDMIEAKAWNISGETWTWTVKKK